MFITVKTDSHRLPTLEIPIRHTPKSTFTITPSKALFVIVPSGSKKTKVISLKPLQEEGVVAHVECDSKDVKIDLSTNQESNTQTIKVTVNPQGAYQQPTTLKTTLHLIDQNQTVMAQIPIHAIFTNAK